MHISLEIDREKGDYRGNLCLMLSASFLKLPSFLDQYVKVNGKGLGREMGRVTPALLILVKGAERCLLYFLINKPNTLHDTQEICNQKN